MSQRHPVRSYRGYLGGIITVFSDRSVKVTPPNMYAAKVSVPIERENAARALRSDRMLYGREWPKRQCLTVSNGTME